MVKYKTYLVEQYLKANKITKQQFCADCNISMSTLQRFLQGDPSVNYVSVIAICSHIGISFTDFVRDKCKIKKLSRGIIKSTSLLN